MKLLMVLSLLASLSAFALETGKPAPDFTLKGSSGKEVKLSDFKGKTVVLEWKNHGCPFIVKHYESGNMQSLQKKYTGKNVVWLSIISSAPGKQGYVDEKGALQDKEKHHSHATDVLLDPTGKVDKTYEAKTTPHMFIIDKTGTLVYQGAIDDHPDTDEKSIPLSKNYVAMALDEVLAGKPVKVATTKSYGCAIKYE